MPSCFKPWVLLVWMVAMQDYVMANELETLFQIITVQQSNKTELVNTFLEGKGKGMDINEKNVKKEGQTALHAAVLEDDAGVVECLLKHNADIEALDDHQRTPLMTAVLYKREKSVKVLLKHNAKTDRIHEANANKGLTPSIREIANGLNAKQWAHDHGNDAVMKVLMKYDPNV
ncbi:ankyrin repeats (3 copies) domain-containing protein [Ditylenchus destructor]|nr:ankyrin repeats (3 copies) domain-containing protein [Ditylenchus destructor]